MGSREAGAGALLNQPLLAGEPLEVLLGEEGIEELLDDGDLGDDHGIRGLV